MGRLFRAFFQWGFSPARLHWLGHRPRFRRLHRRAVRRSFTFICCWASLRIAMVMRNEFRSDLYYRLNVVPITIPPLRERAGDIPLLVQHFVRQFARQMNKQVDAISSEAMEALVQYSWPGNIRELQNIVERAVAIHARGNLTVKKSWLCHGYFHNESLALASFVASATGERDTIGAALARARGRVSGPSGAAAILGVPPSTLESKIRSMNINKYQFKTA